MTACVLASAAVVLLAQTRSWVTTPVLGITGRTTVSADGAGASPGAGAFALVAAAGALAMLLAGRWVRQAIAVVLALAGAAITALAVTVLRAPQDAVAAAVAAATGTVGRSAPGAAVSAWPVVSGLAGVVILVAAVVALLRSPGWPGPSRRYEREESGTATAFPPPQEQDPMDAWDRLSVGEDPTDPSAAP